MSTTPKTLDLLIRTRLLETPTSGAQPAAVKKNGVILGGLLAIGTVLVWLLVIYNRFLTPHEGWFSYYGLLMKSGKVPYRDFYFFTQPVHLLVARIVSEFGDKLIYFRIYGVIDRVILTFLYYYLLSRQFSATAAVCGTVASSFFFLAYPTDALMSYLYTCLLFLLLALACLHKAWESRQYRDRWMVLVGVSAALCFFTKQSNGLLAALGIGFTIVMMSPTVRRTITDLTFYTAGLIAGSVPFVVWLFWTGAWTSYINQVFLGAAASKGGLKAVLFGFVGRQIDRKSIVAFVLLLVGIGILAARRKIFFVRPPQQSLALPSKVVVGAVIGAALLGILTVHTASGFLTFQLMRVTTLEVNIVLYALLPVLAVVLWRRFVNPGLSFVQGNEVTIALLLASVYWTYASGMSWNVAEQAAIPSLGLLLAFLYDRVQIGRTRTMSIVVLFLTLLMTQVGIWHKWNLAFNWEGWFERISPDKAHSHWPQISDFEISRDEVLVYDTILDDIAKYTKPEEPIVTFSTIPLFNFVGRHWQPGFAPILYWDVCPDNIAKAAAAQVKALRPKMIVELELASWVWKEHDQGWRSGLRSGQREFQDVLDGLTHSGDYRMLHSIYTPESDMDLVVWLRVR